MKIQIPSIRVKIRSAFLTALLFGLLSAGSASAMGINGLLGVTPGFPQIDGQGVPGQAVTFTPFGGGTGQLSITSSANLYFPDADTLRFIGNGVLNIDAAIGSTGSMDIGGFSLTSGTTTASDGTPLGDPLLVGSLLEFGLENSVVGQTGTDRMDFLLDPFGGSLLADEPNWPGGLVAITMTLFGSTYDGNLDNPWVAAQADFVVGPQLVASLSEAALLPLMFLALTLIMLTGRRTSMIRK